MVVWRVDRCDTTSGELSLSRTRGGPRSTVHNLLENQEVLEKCK